MFLVSVMSNSDDVYLKAVVGGDIPVRERIGAAMQRTIRSGKLGMVYENYVHYFVKYLTYNNR